MWPGDRQRYGMTLFALQEVVWLYVNILRNPFFLIYFIIVLNFLSHVVCSLNPRLLIQTLLITVYPTSPDCPFFFFFLSPFITPTPFGLLPLRETDEEKGEEKGVVCVCVTTLLFSLRGSCIQHKWHSLASLRA